jgi:hypothetical protein
MEVRLLGAQDGRGRRRFEHELAQARARAGIGFMETPRSRVGRIHLEFGDLYGVFDETEDPDRMLAGFAIHGLDAFGQSYPRPDLTHLPPHAVFEVGELWSCSPGAGVSARWGCGILAGLRDAQALLIYPIIAPWDLTGSYPGFERVGTPILWPFAQTTDGHGILVQPMVVQGVGLSAMVAMVAREGFEASEDHHLLRFGNPLAAAMGIREAMRRARRPDAQLAASPAA